MLMYFLYSEEQIEEKNRILARSYKKFVPGTVVVNGTRHKFSQLSSSPEIARFVDVKIVASGEPSSFTYTLPDTVSTGGI